MLSQTTMSSVDRQREAHRAEWESKHIGSEMSQ